VMKRRFATLDVFTDKALAGNPLAVVLDSEGLGTEAMQAIAREFNLSETVFVLPPEDAVNLARIRIFTPAGELPFAGHPSVGSAVCLALGRGLVANERVNFGLEVKIGTIACTVRVGQDNTAYAWFPLPSLPKEAGAPASAEDIARALGISAGDIGFGGHVPSRFQMGPAFTFVPVASTEVLSRVGMNAGWDAAFGMDDHCAAYIYAPGNGTPAFHARMFSPGMGFSEDPATGSASAAFARVLERFGGLPDGSRTIEIEQGRDMGRPSRIILGIDLRARSLTEVTLGGDAVVIMEGTMRA
jgi:trans-2,3-dihydro-3-hydroxyanthranilate isomerase